MQSLTRKTLQACCSLTRYNTPACFLGGARYCNYTMMGRSSRRFYSNGGASSASRLMEEDPERKGPWSQGDKFTCKLDFMQHLAQGMKPYRVMDHTGSVLDDAHDPGLSKQEVTDLYSKMVTLHIMDGILYEAQRQGRISFYMTHYGEEAMIGSAAALLPRDVVFGQYREAFVLLHRGFTVQECMNQCFSNMHDGGKGRQMPVHYGSSKHNFQTISSPLGTQIPQAAGAAYALKRQGDGACTICYFGEGAASEGDFHAGLNMAATLHCPTIFFCRNNGYAISTPASEQYRGDGIAPRGIGYGIDTVVVDGNDVWAVYNATRAARAIAVEQNKPVLIEAKTYRVGHHSTSDDSTKYRDRKEVEERAQFDNPITRLRRYMEVKQWWSPEDESQLRHNIRKDVLECFKSAEQAPKPAVAELFTDVYDSIPTSLQYQQDELVELTRKYPEYYSMEDHSNGI
ncbi:2-oxoisovalerate dehydrogenase subunitmitochondrial-like [Lichtheimia corymbifera JMRC:FSU:9682]|uniref:2-oxoisovalerate dehydrogenase subunit alpha n=1 Tax=Lichtheimia corymbifera JMRC:FSU:9682 TaxID=1263082 RepID=A0A068SE47_9FUNG|nr:2-oxoisovalerate dehydrogenase subunitmitochondrial-like [Lichtheimia corymbifera JMRC:FSU:9682]